MLRSVFTIIYLFFVLILYSQSTPTKPINVGASNQPLLPNLRYEGGIKLYLSTSSYFYDVGEPIFCHLLVVNACNLQPVNLILPCRISLSDGSGQIIYSKTVETNFGDYNRQFDTSFFKVGGEYLLKAECIVNGENISASKTIIVQQNIRRNLLIETIVAKEQYVPGDSLKMKIKLMRSNGLVAFNEIIDVIEIYNEQLIDTFSLKCDENGIAHFSRRIDESYTDNNLIYLIKGMVNGVGESYLERINLNTGKVLFSSYLENGHYKVSEENTVVFFTSNINGDLVKSTCQFYNLKTMDSFLIETNDYGFGRFNIPRGDSIHHYIVFAGTGRQYFYRLKADKESTFSISVKKKNDNEITYCLSSSTLKNIRFICHIRGKVIVDSFFVIPPSGCLIKVPIKHQMPGVLQAIIFNDKNEMLGQKLNFINRKKQLKVHSTSLVKSVSKSQVNANLNFKITDENNEPVEGVFNLSLTDHGNKLLLEDKQSRISENLLFESDLKYPSLDIGKLWKCRYENYDSLIDLFLNGCELNNRYLPKIMGKSARTSSYYQFTLEKVFGSIDRSLNKEVARIVIKSNKGIYRTKLNERNEIYIPVDSVTLPCKIIILGEVREVFYANETHTKVVLRSNVDLADDFKKDSFYLVDNYIPIMNNDLMFLVDPVIPELSLSAVENKTDHDFKTGQSVWTGLANLVSGITASSSSISGRGSRTDATAYFIDGVRVYTSYCSTSISSSKLYMTNIRRIMPVLGLQAGVTSTATGYSNRGSRTDANALYIDGMRIMTSHETGLEGISYSDLYSGIRFPVIGGRYNAYSNYPSQNTNRYNIKKYRPNGFPIPVSQNFSYMHPLTEQQKNTTTFYYETGIVSDSKGEFSTSIKLPNLAMVYHLDLEGVGKGGLCAEFDSTLSIERDVYMTIKTPVFLLDTDTAMLTCSVYNNSQGAGRFNLHIYLPNKKINESVEIGKGMSKDINFSYNSSRAHILRMELMNDEDDQLIQSIARPINILEKQFKTETILNLVKGTMHTIHNPKQAERTVAKVCIYKSQMDNIDSKLTNMIQEPHGCFEQVSSTNYPNILAYRFLIKNNLGYKFDSILKIKKSYLEIGYNSLCRYETKQGGFSWYGEGIGNEALTAMGLLQFEKLKGCGIQVSEPMIHRNKSWLLKSKNKEGFFVQSPGRYGFANTSPKVAHAYITYVLNELGERDLDESIELIEAQLKQESNFYNEALLFAIYVRNGQTKKSKTLYEKLFKKVIAITDRKTTIEEPIASVVNSYYQAALNESLCIISNCIYASENYDYLPLAKWIGNYILKQDFNSLGNMQTKAMAIETISYSIQSQQDSSENGLSLEINNKLFNFKIGINQNQAIDISEYLQKGENSIKLVSGKVNIVNSELFVTSYFPKSPSISSDSDLRIVTEIVSKKVGVGDVLNYSVSFTNSSDKILPQTVAVLQIPAGVSIKPSELLFLKKNSVIDFYEIMNGEIIIYFEEMKKGQKVSFILPLIAEIRGQYSTKGSCIYKYYQANHKTICKSDKLIIE